MSNKAGVSIIFLIILLFIANTNCFCSQDQFQECLSFYNRIYEIMDKEYFKDVSREEFEKFIDEVKTVYKSAYSNKILQQDELDQFKYGNAGVLVNWLKYPQDIYSCFRPPEEAKEFEKRAFGYEESLGINEGQLIDKGFKVTEVEPRSDSFEKGLRENDIIIKINDEFVKNLTNDQIDKKLLKAEPHAKVNLRIISYQDNQEKELVITCEKFDKKTSFLIPTREPDIFCIKIKLFNKMILEDLNEILADLRDKAISGIILDFRGNQGGTLDFQDNKGETIYIIENLAGYFIELGKRLYYIETKSPGQKEFFSKESYFKKSYYRVPLIGLMNEKTASAAELILGVLRTCDKITLVGQNSQGAGYQKKSWSFIEDEKQGSLELVTSVFYLSDGSTFDNKDKALKPDPDYEILDDERVLSSAVDNLIKQREMNIKRTKAKLL